MSEDDLHNMGGGCWLFQRESPEPRDPKLPRHRVSRTKEARLDTKTGVFTYREYVETRGARGGPPKYIHNTTWLTGHVDVATGAVTLDETTLSQRPSLAKIVQAQEILAVLIAKLPRPAVRRNPSEEDVDYADDLIVQVVCDLADGKVRLPTMMAWMEYGQTAWGASADVAAMTSLLAIVDRPAALAFVRSVVAPLVKYLPNDRRAYARKVLSVMKDGRYEAAPAGKMGPMTKWGFDVFGGMAIGASRASDAAHAIGYAAYFADGTRGPYEALSYAADALRSKAARRVYSNLSPHREERAASFTRQADALRRLVPRAPTVML